MTMTTRGVSSPADAPPGMETASAVTGASVIAVAADGSTREVGLDQLPAALADDGARLWVDLVDPPEPQVAAVTAALGIHPLVAEDIVERNQRAKVEEVDGIIHLVLFALRYEREVREAEIDVVLGARFVLTVHGGEVSLRDAPLLRVGVGSALRRGPDYLVYAISDWIVDGYFPALDALADDIDQLEDEVIDAPTKETLATLFALKRNLISLRRATSPAREIFNTLTNRELPVVRPDHVVYFRDVYDHLIRVTDEVDNYRELVAGALEAYLSTVNNNLSLIMKRLTGVTVVLAGIGAIAGIFGMSEAGAALAGGEASGFWMVTAVIVVIATVVALALRRIDWI